MTRYVSAATLPTITWGSDSVQSRTASAKAIDRATKRARRSHEVSRLSLRAARPRHLQRRAQVTAVRNRPRGVGYAPPPKVSAMRQVMAKVVLCRLNSVASPATTRTPPCRDSRARLLCVTKTCAFQMGVIDPWRSRLVVTAVSAALPSKILISWSALRTVGLSTSAVGQSAIRRRAVSRVTACGARGN